MSRQGSRRDRRRPRRGTLPTGTGSLRLDGLQAIDFGAFRTHRRLRRVARFVAYNYAGSVTRSRAATVAGLEENYFSDYFHRKVGICFKDWLGLWRTARAMRLLETKNRSIRGVAQAVGYRDVGTFRRTFKKHAGMTPRAFKRVTQVGAG